MSAFVTPHLNFRGDAREALDFYASVFGGTASIVTYAEMQAPHDPAQADLVVFGQVEAPSGIRVMAYDVQTALPYDQGVNSLYLSVRCQSADEIESFWAGLCVGAEVEQDLGPSGWSPLYGKLRDRFGVVWVLDVAA